MLLNRQHPSESTPSAPQKSVPEKYGQPHCDISGKLYCTDKNGNVVSLCSTANFSQQSDNSLKTNNHTINKDIPSSAAFSDFHYSFSESSENGTFAVRVLPTGDTEESESNYNVAIHGLGSAAYEPLENLASKEDLKSVDAISLSGSSLQDIINFIKDYVDNKEVTP